MEGRGVREKETASGMILVMACYGVLSAMSSGSKSQRYMCPNVHPEQCERGGSCYILIFVCGQMGNKTKVTKFPNFNLLHPMFKLKWLCYTCIIPSLSTCDK